MEFKSLKDKVYYWDGAWLDIYVLNATREDWKKWIEFVNEKFQVSFYHGENQTEEARMIFQKIVDFWDGKTEHSNYAIIKVGKINVKCHFFNDDQIENDFDPGEVESVEDHDNLIKYMDALSELLIKPIILCPENRPNDVYISVEKGDLKINLN